METNGSPRRYVLDVGVEVYPAGEELIAVQTERDEVHRLNPTAAEILGACDGRSVEEIARHLRECYPEVPGERIDEDLGDILSVLADKGVIRLVQPGIENPSGVSS